MHCTVAVGSLFRLDFEPSPNPRGCCNQTSTTCFYYLAKAFTLASNWTKTEPERYIFSTGTVRPLHHQSYNTIKGVDLPLFAGATTPYHGINYAELRR